MNFRKNSSIARRCGLFTGGLGLAICLEYAVAAIAARREIHPATHFGWTFEHLITAFMIGIAAAFLVRTAYPLRERHGPSYAAACTLAFFSTLKFSRYFYILLAALSELSWLCAILSAHAGATLAAVRKDKLARVAWLCAEAISVVLFLGSSAFFGASYLSVGE